MPRIADLVDDAKKTSSADRLDELSTHPSKTVRIAVAENAASTAAVILRLADDRDDLVRLAAAVTAERHPSIHAALARSDDKWVRAILAHSFARNDDRSLSYDVQRMLVEDVFWEVRIRIAETTNYADVFETCLRDRDPRVRGWCGGNPRITRAQMDELLRDRRWETRSLAVTCGLRYPDDAQLLFAARDKSATVRGKVLFRVDRPVEAIEIISDDSDVANQRHARSMLAGEPHMTQQVIDFDRDERRRASRGLEFESPPSG